VSYIYETLTERHTAEIDHVFQDSDESASQL